MNTPISDGKFVKHHIHRINPKFKKMLPSVAQLK